MTVERVLDVAANTIYTIIITSAPLLIISLVVGLVISIFQAVTSIQEQTLTFVPKILAIFIGMLVFGKNYIICIHRPFFWNEQHTSENQIGAFYIFITYIF